MQHQDKVRKNEEQEFLEKIWIDHKDTKLFQK